MPISYACIFLKLLQDKMKKLQVCDIVSEFIYTNTSSKLKRANCDLSGLNDRCLVAGRKTGHILPVVKVHRQRNHVVHVLKPSQNTNRLRTIRRSTIGAGQKTAVNSKKDD